MCVNGQGFVLKLIVSEVHAHNTLKQAIATRNSVDCK